MDANRFKTNTDKTPGRSTDGFIRSGQRRPSTLGTPQRRQRRRIGVPLSTIEGFHSANNNNQVREALGPELRKRNPQRNDLGRIELSMPDSAPRKKKRFPSLKTARKTFSTLIVAVILVTGYVSGKAYLQLRDSFRGGSAGAAGLQENVDPTLLNGEGDGRVNVLLLGRGGDGHEAPDLTDTLVVASIDPIENQATLLSIPRDLWVSSEFGYSKINATYVNAKNNAAYNGSNEQEAEDIGLTAIENTVEEHMGIPIHYHIMVNFQAFKQAVDTVGGVDVNVPDAVYDNLYIDGRNYVLDVQPGQRTFNGFEALAYTRSRYTSKRGDFDRAERQRLVLIGLKNKIFSLGTFGNPAKVSQLISDFGNNIRSNLSPNELLRLYEIGSNINADNITSLGLADPPNNFVQTANIGGQSVVVPTAGTYDYSAIRSFVRNSLKDPFIKRENATIAVYNGTNIPGLAGSRAEELESFGYNISTVANAVEQDYQQTILVDLSGGQKDYTKNYLERRLKTIAVSSMPQGSTISTEGNDFVIILGRNESLNQ